MTLHDAQPPTQPPTVGEAIGKCWGRFKTWVDWLSDPEGPPFTKFILDLALRFFGLLFAIFGILVLLDTFTLRYITLLETIHLRYIGAGFLLLGATLYVVGRHGKRVELKTAAYSADIDALICDVEQILDNLKDDQQRENAKEEIRKLRRFNEKPSEVSIKRLKCLQKIKIDALDESALIAHARSSLDDYKFFVEGDEMYIRYKGIINDLMCANEIND